VLSALQCAIFYPLRHIGRFAVAFLVIGFVIGPVAQKQARLAVAFERPDAEAVEKLTVIWTISEGGLDVDELVR